MLFLEGVRGVEFRDDILGSLWEESWEWLTDDTEMEGQPAPPFSPTTAVHQNREAPSDSERISTVDSTGDFTEAPPEFRKFHEEEVTRWKTEKVERAMKKLKSHEDRTARIAHYGYGKAPARDGYHFRAEAWRSRWAEATLSSPAPWLSICPSGRYFLAATASYDEMSQDW